MKKSLFFGLSRAESRIASLLVQGKNVNKISEELRFTLNTVRTHLKRVFEKTNTRRQAELVDLILRAVVSSCLRERSHHLGDDKLSPLSTDVTPVRQSWDLATRLCCFSADVSHRVHKPFVWHRPHTTFALGR